MRFKLVENLLNEKLLVRGESGSNHSDRHQVYAGIFFEPYSCYKYAQKHQSGIPQNKYGTYKIYILDDSAKIYTDIESSVFLLDEAEKNNLKFNKRDYDILEKFIDDDSDEISQDPDFPDTHDYEYYKNNKYKYNIIDLVKQTYDTFAICNHPIAQYLACQILKKRGFDGANWLHEDDLTPEQYQIWNINKLKLITPAEAKKYEQYEDQSDWGF